MQLVSTCIKCGLTIDSENGKCPNCSDKLAQAESDSKLSIMKIIKYPLIKYPLIGLALILIVGISVQFMTPDCHCSLEGCGGCGGAIGNALVHFSGICMALAVMGFVLLVWFGIPILLLGLIFTWIYKLLNKKGKDE